MVGRVLSTTAVSAVWCVCGGMGLMAAEAKVREPATFYVDSEHGRDAQSGVTPEQAWRTLEHVNTAELMAGDTVRFKRGSVWRGQLKPVSGEDGAPVTYTTYGEGEKPLILGSRPRSRPEDWVQVREGVWATLPVEHSVGEELLGLRQSDWGRHQEAGAEVAVSRQESPEGRVYRFECGNSGRARNHVQVWGPTLSVAAGAHIQMTFRARSTEPFRIVQTAIRLAHSPWTTLGSSGSTGPEIGTEWRTVNVRYHVARSSEEGRPHMYLGGCLPAGAVFELQPQSLRLVTSSVADPLSVDVGNIIFDHGEVCGWKKWGSEDLDKPYDYWYDGTTWRVFLRSDRNPATVHDSIELALKRHVVDQSSRHHVVYDGLAVRYGAAHGFGGGGTHHLVIRNCDLSYIGGGHQFSRDGRHVRYGNAIEFWGAAHDHLVEGCRLWEVYDAALTNQGRGPSSKQVNITYRNNVVWNAEYSFEYWNNPETALTRGIRFVNNTCVDAGMGWAHAQRPDRNGSHLMFYSNTAVSSGIEVKYNVFCNATEWESRYDRGWDPLPDMDHNVWFSTTGVMVRHFGKTIKGFQEYRDATGLDRHSVYADPRFVDPERGDYRLGPDSPARGLRPDGGAVGAESLWDAPVE